MSSRKQQQTTTGEAHLPVAWAGREVRVDAQPYRMSAQQVTAWRGVWRMLLDRAAAQPQIAARGA